MILTHLGFPYNFIKWIMCSISNVSFSILINDYASPFFHSKRRLHQGCPLSPLLFLLIMEALSRLIMNEKHLGCLQGIRIANGCTLNHLLFVDDVLIFLNGSIGDILSFVAVLANFSIATGMVCNALKSSITINKRSPQERGLSLNRYPFPSLNP